jgi:hypothetical protein
MDRSYSNYQNLFNYTHISHCMQRAFLTHTALFKYIMFEKVNIICNYNGKGLPSQWINEYVI